jgi:class 3 adenylate cyclase
VSAARKDFVVVALGDREAHGYDEHTLPILVRVTESSAPDAQLSTHHGMIAFYLNSPKAIAAVSDLISAVETLREADHRFASLGIGVAHGPLLAEFDWRGRVKKSFTPLGETANKASAGVIGPQNYQETLNELQGTPTV